MIVPMMSRIFTAYRAPRLSARWIIERAPSMPDCLLMVVLASVLQSFFTVAVNMALGENGGQSVGGGGIGMRMTELVLQLVLFVALSAGAFAIGRRFGGAASPDQIAAVVAWHYLATAFLAPINLIGARAALSEGGAGALALLIPFSIGVSVWIFACFVAEAHGFRRLGPVVAASVAGFVALGFLSMTLVAALPTF